MRRFFRDVLFNEKMAWFVNGIILPLLVYYLYILLTTTAIDGKLLNLYSTQEKAPYTLILQQSTGVVVPIIMYDNPLLGVFGSDEKGQELREGKYYKFIVSGFDRCVWKLK